MVDRKVVLYAIAVGAALAGVASQYVVPTSWIPSGLEGFVIGTVLGLFLAYGIGLLVFYWFFGTRPLRNYVRRNSSGAKEAFRWYGIFTLFGLLLALVLAAVFVAVEPHRFMELEPRMTPDVQAAEQNPLFYILLSIFVVGFAEETIFRGYILGTLLTIQGTKRWRVHAVWTSVLFACAHIYYAQTYDEAALIPFVEIVSLGLAFSYAYVLSGGNIFFIAILHGTYDAVSFWSVVPGQAVTADVVHYAVVLVAALWALYLYVHEKEGPDHWDGRPEVPPELWPPDQAFLTPVPPLPPDAFPRTGGPAPFGSPPPPPPPSSTAQAK